MALKFRRETISMSANTAAPFDHAEIPHGNAEILKTLYDAFTAGDVETAARFVTDDYVLHVPGRSANAGEYWGSDGLKKFMSNIAGYNGGLFEMTVPAFALSGDDAFTREVIRLNRRHDPEREFILRITNQFKFRDGKLVESWVVPEDQYVYDDYYHQLPAGGYEAPLQRLASGNGGGRPRQTLLDTEHATSPESTQLLSDMYADFWRGDGARMRALIADDVVVDITHHSAMSGLYQGWDGYMTFRSKLMAMAGDKYKLEVSALAGNDTDVFATEQIRMNRAWDPTVRAIAVIMHFEIRDGKIARMDDFPLEPLVWEEMYTPPSSR
jgi:ketosteroid isomerase-like protein